jgi:hypothetical protein
MGITLQCEGIDNTIKMLEDLCMCRCSLVNTDSVLSKHLQRILWFNLILENKGCVKVKRDYVLRQLLDD